MQKIILALLVLLTLNINVHSRSIKQIRKTGLIVGVRTTAAPFGKMNSVGMNGIEYEIGKAVAKQLGYKFRHYEVETLAEGKKLLSKGTIDILISLARKDNDPSMIYSDPYYKTGLGIMIKKNNSNIYSAVDLNRKYVAAVASSSGYNFLKKFIRKAKIELVSSVEETYTLLKNGEVDAILNDKVLLDYEASINPMVKVLDLTLTEEQYVIGINKKYTKLLQYVNKALKTLKKSVGGSSKLGRIYSDHGVSVPSFAKNNTLSSGTKSKSSKSKSGSTRDKINQLMKEVDRIKRELEKLKREL